MKKLNEDMAPQEPTKVNTSVGAIEKDVRDQASNFKNIRTDVNLVQLLDALVGKLDPKFRESAAFKKGLLDFYRKHK